MFMNSFMQSWKAMCAGFFKDMWNVPNVLTMLRIVLIPVYLVVYYQCSPLAALVVYCVASFTDLLDGYLARKNNQITTFGKLMDPLADKVMVISVMLTQVISGVIPWPVLAIVLIKECIMIWGAYEMLRRGIVVYSHLIGKFAQCAFILGLFLSFFHKEFQALGASVDQSVLWISVGLTIGALFHYTVSGLKAVKANEKEMGK